MTDDINQPLTLLLEIGVEEIPATFLPSTVVQLKGAAEGVLSDSDIEFKQIMTCATPRRLSVIATGVSEYQKSKVMEYYGPPQRAAFTLDGKPTKAALSFAQLHGIEVENLIIKQKTEHDQTGKTKQKGQYVVAVIQENGLAVRDIAASLFTRIVTSLHFPKSMRWAGFDVRFVRPVRWLTALCLPQGSSPQPEFVFGGVKSSNVTYGHRFLSNRAITVSDTAQYHADLEANYVVLEQDKRRQMIWQGCLQAASEFGARPVADDGLLEEITYLVEYPLAVVGEFDGVYLNLPRELLITVLRDHQRCFAIESEDGRLLNRFIVVGNTVVENADVVRAGAQRVIRARLEDARFYYDDDLKVPLIQRLEDLKGIVFQERLGTVFDKVERLIALGDLLRLRLFHPATTDAVLDREKLLMAIRLCKADLTTGVVRQFPELQGVMGKYYALKGAQEADVAQSIFEHYLPTYAGDTVPITNMGVIISLADKFDNLVSFFSIGLSPTGSEDPYALRRQAMGIISILIQRGFSVTLEELLTETVDVLKRQRTVLEDLYAFFRQRLQSLFSTTGYPHDIIQSSMDRFQSVELVHLLRRMEALKWLKDQVRYNEFLFAFKRIHNIVAKESKGIENEYVVNPHIMGSEHERRLYETLEERRADVESAVVNGEFRRALESITGLIEPINVFFDKVLVMDKDEQIRRNKLALLREILRTTSKIADISKMQEK
ncbi:MAG: glycine--tRNA ligase subunit beta [Nitrospirae bacterium]|nr:glycine--tRNA ligase subunit beta [Nitrospirota bacterium]